jgi:alpha-glucosidase (family GH31 glycosyl hydrolase)
MYPTVFSQLRQAMQLRAVLFPTLYTGAAATFKTGVAFVHPMYYSWPTSEAAYATVNDYQYMLGDNILVRPVVEPMPTATPPYSASSSIKVSVWLPPIQEGWVCWNSSALVPGTEPVNLDSTSGNGTNSDELEAAAHGTTVIIDADVSTLPIFVRAGTALSLLPLDTVDISRDDAIAWALFPGVCGGGGGVGSTLSSAALTGPMQGGGSVYLDDGETTEYESGSSAQQTLTYEWKDQKRQTMNITIIPAVSQGGSFYPSDTPKRHTLELRCPAVGATSAAAGVSAYVMVNGTREQVTVGVQGPHLLARPEKTLVLELPRAYGPHEQIEVVVQWV